MDSKKAPRNRNTRTLKPALTLLSLALLSACANNNAPPNLTPHLTPNAQTFNADGKLALRYPRCNPYRACKPEAISAKYHWQHEKTADTLALYDPTGQEQLKLRYQGQTVLLQDKNGSRQITRDELAKELGISIPIDTIHKWLFTPSQADSYTEQGWKIQPRDWQNDHYQTLTLSRQDYYLKLIIQNLQTN